MTTEIIGTSAVKRALAKSDLLLSNIPENNTLPIWDGEVYVFRKKGHRNKNLIGQVPVQVKCFKDKLGNKDTLGFSVDLIDLEAYKNDGGVIYFVVKTTPDGLDVIYYGSLLPVDLIQELSKVKNQKNKTIRFEKFPENVNEIEAIFFDFLEHKKLQSSVNNQTKLYTPDELHKFGYTNHFFKVRAKNLLDIVGKETYQYSREINTGAILCSPKGLISSVNFNDKTIQLSVNKANYFTGAEVKHLLKNITEFNFGHGNVVIKETPEKSELTMTPNGTLSEHLNTCLFAIDAEAANGFSLNNIQTTLSNNENRKNAVTAFKTNVNILNNIKSMLSTIGVNEDIPLNDVKTINFLSYITASILEEKPISVTNLKTDGLVRVDIVDNKNLVFIATPAENGTVLIKDLFQPNKFKIHITVTENESKIAEFDAPQFFLLHESYFYNAINFNLDIVHEDVMSYLYNSDLKGDDRNFLINYIIMHYWFKLLKAFDVTNDQKFIKKAKDVIKKLEETGFSENLNEVIILNKLQIIRRQRNLTNDEILTIDKIINSIHNTEILAGAYLLKGDIDNAKSEYDKLNDETKAKFDTYPITKFWK